MLFSCILFAEEVIPEFNGMYVQTKDNKFIELQSHNKWSPDYYSKKRKTAGAYSKTNNFIINNVKLEDFKYFISRGNRYIDELEYATKVGLNNGYYWIAPSRSGKKPSIRWATNGAICKAKVDINKKDIFWIWWNYHPYLVKFY
jgi:hypothetical protein